MAKRVDGLVVDPFGSELVVYVPSTNEAHALNETASVVFDLCDGESTREQMVSALQALGLPGDEGIVDLALADLARSGLIIHDDEPSAPAGVDRRTLIRRLGLSAAAVAALPALETILVQPAYAVQASALSTTPTTTQPLFTTPMTTVLTTAFTTPPA
jgi:hypothetical protein